MQRIAVARDRAFNFAYRENLDRLAEMGQVLFFSPLAGDMAAAGRVAAKVPGIRCSCLPGEYAGQVRSILNTGQRRGGPWSGCCDGNGKFSAFPSCTFAGFLLYCNQEESTTRIVMTRRKLP